MYEDATPITAVLIPLHELDGVNETKIMHVRVSERERERER